MAVGLGLIGGFAFVCRKSNLTDGFIGLNILVIPFSMYNLYDGFLLMHTYLILGETSITVGSI